MTPGSMSQCTETCTHTNSWDHFENVPAGNISDFFFFSPALHLFMLGAAEVESGWKFKEYESSYHHAAKNPAMAEWFLTSEASIHRRLWDVRLRYF